MRNKKAIHMDLRQASGSGVEGDANDAQIWNQGVYKFSAVFAESPTAKGTASEKAKQVVVTNTFCANEDQYPSPGNPEDGVNPKREQVAVYRLIYDSGGDIDAAYGLSGGVLEFEPQDWIAMTKGSVPLFIPSASFDVTEGASSRALDNDANPGRNPNITAGRLKALGVTKR